jgi:hypothetical protein
MIRIEDDADRGMTRGGADRSDVASRPDSLDPIPQSPIPIPIDRS